MVKLRDNMFLSCGAGAFFHQIAFSGSYFKHSRGEGLQFFSHHSEYGPLG